MSDCKRRRYEDKVHKVISTTVKTRFFYEMKHCRTLSLLHQPSALPLVLLPTQTIILRTNLLNNVLDIDAFK